LAWPWGLDVRRRTAAKPRRTWSRIRTGAAITVAWANGIANAWASGGTRHMMQAIGGAMANQ